jgi:pilus assembly protein CpaE
LLSAGLTGFRVDRVPTATLALRLLGGGAHRDVGAIVLDVAGTDAALSLLNDLRLPSNPPDVYAATLDATPSASAELATRSGRCRILSQIDDFPRMLVEDRPAIARKSARLVLFAPAQDGSGASTTALHTAILLARDHRLRTLFAELDYHSDSIACRLRLSHAKSLAEVGPGQDWRAVVARWNDLHVLAAPGSPRILRRQGAPDFQRVVEDSGQDYDIVIGDLPCNTAAAAPETLAAAEKIYVVATAEVTSLYLARRRILELTTVGADRGAIRLIINRDRPGAVDSELAHKVTGLDPAYRLPNDFAEASRAETEGREVDSRSALGQAYAQLAARIVGKPAAGAQPNRWGRLLTAFR